MNELIYNLRVEQYEPSKIEDIYNSFTALGWKYNGHWNLEDVHTFLQFTWDKKNQEPIYPEGFGLDKPADTIHTDKFARPL